MLWPALGRKTGKARVGLRWSRCQDGCAARRFPSPDAGAYLAFVFKNSFPTACAVSRISIAVLRPDGTAQGLIVSQVRSGGRTRASAPPGNIALTFGLQTAAAAAAERVQIEAGWRESNLDAVQRRARSADAKPGREWRRRC